MLFVITASYMGRHKTLCDPLISNKNPVLLQETGYWSANPYSLRHDYTGWNFFNGLSYVEVAITIPIRMPLYFGNFSV